MTHLSREELLLHCDGELVSPRAEHCESCVSCQRAMVDVQVLLLEVEHELRSSIPPETAESRAASWTALENTLYPPQRVLRFPLRWSPAYGLAAVLLIALFGGYLALRQPSVGPPAEVVELTDSAGKQAPGAATHSGQPVITPAEIASEVESPEAIAGEKSSAAVEHRTAIAAVRQTPARAVTVAERFTMPKFAAAPPPAKQIAFSTLELAAALEPAIGGLPSVADPLLAPFAAAEGAAVPAGKVTPKTAESLLAAIEGRWMLMKAGVWEQDVEPDLRKDKLFFVGSVENAVSEQQFTAAVSKAAGSRTIGFDLRRRQQGATATAREEPHPVMKTAPRPVTGVVRNSLLAHFSDTAQRSFQTPTPAVLESELDRYVTDVFRSQSQLLAHVYSLNSLLSSAGAKDVERLEAAAVEKFRDVMSFHLAAASEQQARIYDRLSEALPRRFWAYRETEPKPADKAAWADESGELLQQTLLLDGTLTELLGSPQPTVDASSASPSPGHLLQRIRSKISRLRNHSQALQ